MEKTTTVTFCGIYKSPLDAYLNGILLEDKSFLFVQHDGKRYGWMHTKTASDGSLTSKVQVRYLGPWEPKHNTLSLHELCELFHCSAPLTQHDLEIRIREGYRNKHQADIELYSKVYETLYGRPALDSILATVTTKED